MADIEIRAFGWRFLGIVEKQAKPAAVETVPDAPPLLSYHSGHFDVHTSTYYDDKAVTMHRFGFEAR